MNNKFDMAIIGAGITGIGVAVSAVKAGHSVILIEKNGIAEGTSNNSMRIIHGGFRYLQSLNFSRTIKSLKAQKEILENYSDCAEPLECKMALKRFGLKSKYPAICGALLYTVLQKILKSPLPNPEVKDSCLYWYDACLKDPLDFAKKLVEENNLQVKTNTAIREIEFASSEYQIYADNFSCQAKTVVDATGIGSENIKYKNFNIEKHDVEWVKSFNLLIKNKLNLQTASTTYGKTGRLYFMVPRKDCLALGTFYKNYDGSLEVSNDNIVDILNEFQDILPEDVIRPEVGLLPARKSNGNSDKESYLLSSDIIRHNNGFIKIIPVKYTTFLLTGRKVLAVLRSFLKV